MTVKSSFARALPVAMLLTGCADVAPDGGEGEGEVPVDGDPAVLGEPLFAVSTIEVAPGSGFAQREGLLKFTSTLSAGVTFDESRTIEMPTDGVAFGRDLRGEVFMTDNSNGSIHKYRLKEDDSMEEVGQLSFGFFGSTAFDSLSHTVGFASKDRAYLFDGDAMQFYVWDPEAMVIVSNLDVSAPELAGPTDTTVGWKPWGDHEPLRVGDKLYWSFGYFDLPTYSGPGESMMMVIDTTNDSVKFVRNTDCGGLQNTVQVGEELFVSTSVHYASAFHGGGEGREQMTASCVAKFDIASETFTGTVDLTPFTATRPFGGLIESTNGTFNIRVMNLDDTAPFASSTKNAQLFSISKVWETFKLDSLTNLQSATTLPDFQKTASHPYVNRTNGVTYAQLMDWGDANPLQKVEGVPQRQFSKVISQATDTPTVGIEIDGWQTGIVQIRGQLPE